MWSEVSAENLFERIDIDATALACSCLLENVTQEVACWSWIHEVFGYSETQAPLIGMTT